MPSVKPRLRAADPPKRLDDLKGLRGGSLVVGTGEAPFPAVEKPAGTTTLVGNGRRRFPKDARFVARIGIMLGVLALFAWTPATQAQFAFGAARARLSSLDEAARMLRGFPGITSLLVVDGRDRATLNAHSPLAVGSAFTLAVLAALKDEIVSGKRHWRDVVALQPEWRSIGSGVLRSWPDGSSLTLETLATLMISQNDNTAADALMHTVGREAIEALAPRNRPFLTTRERAVLRDARNRDLLDRYRSGEEGTRRSVLPALAARPLPDPEQYAEQRRAFDLEWYFTARELCSLIARVSDLPLMAINPGPAVRSEWGRVAYKGGSGPGVMNLTSYLRRRNGNSVCVAATWNSDQGIEERRLSALVAAVIDLLR